MQNTQDLSPSKNLPNQPEQKNLVVIGEQTLKLADLIGRPKGLENWYIDDNAGGSLSDFETAVIYYGLLLVQTTGRYDVEIDFREFWKYAGIEHPTGAHYRQLADAFPKIAKKRTFMRYTDQTSSKTLTRTINWVTTSTSSEEDKRGYLTFNPDLFSERTYSSQCSFSTIRALKSRYSQRLFEHFMDALGDKPFVTMSLTFHEFLAIIDATHIQDQTPKYVNRCYHNPSIKELNEKVAEFQVSCTKLKDGRSQIGWSYTVIRSSAILNNTSNTDEHKPDDTTQEPQLLQTEQKAENLLQNIVAVKKQICYDSILAGMQDGSISPNVPRRLDLILESMAGIYCLPDEELISLGKGRKVLASQAKEMYRRIDKESTIAVLQALANKPSVNLQYVRFALFEEPANAEGRRLRKESSIAQAAHHNAEQEFRAQIHYDLLTQLSFRDNKDACDALNQIIQVVAETLATKRQMTAINGQAMLTEHIQVVLKGAKESDVFNVVNRYLAYSDTIADAPSYLLTALYNEILTPSAEEYDY